jgi:hypothetical protein
MVMKLLPFLALLALASTGPLASAQTPDDPTAVPRSATRGLDRAEAQRLAAARERAKNDPTVKALLSARESVDEQIKNAMHAAILAAEPDLAPALERVRQSSERAGAVKQGLRELTPEQRQQLQAARAAAQQDPAVIAAREQLKAADQPEARRAAARGVGAAMQEAMLRHDPSLAPLLAQMGPAAETRRGPGSRPERPERPERPGRSRDSTR